MKAAILILAQLLGPLTWAIPVQPPSEETAAARCCCCPAGACDCGCEVPGAPVEPRDGEQQDKARFCVCDDTPLGLPNAPLTAAERPAAAGVLLVLPVDSAGRTPITHRSTHWPHGPPPAIAILATIILLN